MCDKTSYCPNPKEEWRHTDRQTDVRRFVPSLRKNLLLGRRRSRLKRYLGRGRRQRQARDFKDVGAEKSVIGYLLVSWELLYISGLCI